MKEIESLTKDVDAEIKATDHGKQMVPFYVTEFAFTCRRCGQTLTAKSSVEAEFLALQGSDIGKARLHEDLQCLKGLVEEWKHHGATHEAKP